MSSKIYELLGIDPPSDLQAEQAVLGSVLIEPDRLEEIRETLIGNEFYAEQHQTIYRCMTELSDTGDPIDLITLTARLDKNNELDAIGNVSYLTKLAGSVPTTAHAIHYASIIKEKYVLRVSMEANMAFLQQAAASGDPSAVVTNLQIAATKLSDLSAPKKEFSSIRNVLMNVYENAEARFANRHQFNGVTGVPTGYDDLDKMTSGFQKSDLIIVAARPSVGKTAFALNIAQSAAKKIKETIAIFSLEMSEAQLVQRMVCAEGNIDATKMRTGFFESSDWEKMTEAVSALAETKIVIDDTPGINVYDIRSKCRRLKREQGLGMIVIDYLQLIGGKRGENRQQEVSEISRMLKQIARELEVPVVALSQLSRNVEQRQDKRPMLSDLRESGSIEQDADIVAFLYRDDYYNQDSEKKNIIEIIIAKQRNGPVGTVELVFLKQFNKFVSYERSEQPSQSAS